MAGADRAQAQHLAFLSAVDAESGRYGLFPVVRGAEARARELPRIGDAKRPELNIVDLAQDQHMGFANSTLNSVMTRNGRTRIGGFWLGLTGPMGPLPTHMSEFAFYERRYSAKRPFGDWLDVLAGRMLQFFYRAWADSQPAALADRPSDDAFAYFVAALSGAAEGVDPEAAFPAHARSHYAGLFGGSRSAVAIEDSLSHLLGQRAHILEFQARWRTLEPEDLSRLGGTFATLGRSVVLGRRVRSASDAFRVVIRAANFRDYKSLLPTGKRFAIAAEALEAFRPSHIEWDICLEIEDDHAPSCRLDGRTRLGWSSWVKSAGSGKRLMTSVVRADAHLRKHRKSSRGSHP
jgi:type VI secretion system ImpH/TssG family protein